MKLSWIDSEVTQIQTVEGKLTLKGLFLPLFVEQLLMSMMGTVNTLVLGHYSDDAVAAVGAANQVVGFVYTIYAVISGGASIVISHRLGADKEKEAGDVGFSAIVFAAGLSLVCSIILAGCAQPLMRMLNLEEQVLRMAVQYFRICISFSFLQGIISAVSAIFRSYGKPKIAVGVSLLMNVVNAFFNYIVVFRPIEIPLHGVGGIAAVNVGAHLLALVVILICLAKSGLPLHFREKSPKSLRCIKSILQVGLPGGVSSLSYSLSQVVSTSILGVLGTIALSTKIYVSSIVFYVYVTGYSLGLSTAILIGWMVGAKEYDKAYRLNQQVLRIAVTLNLTLSVALFLCYRPLMGLFTQSRGIISMAQGILFIDIFVEIGRAFNHIEENSLRGAGDVVFPMVIAIISCWVMSICFSYILGIWLGFGLYGCWIAFMLDELFRGLIFWRRFRSRKWENRKI